MAMLKEVVQEAKPAVFDTCQRCNGKGYKWVPTADMDVDAEDCDTCQGAGVVQQHEAAVNL